VFLPARLRLPALAGLLLVALVFASLAMLSPGRREGAPTRPPAAATVADAPADESDRPPVPSGCAGPPPAPENADFEARVVELVNERRRAAGRPPLKQAEELTGSSRWFARAMATQDYEAEDHNSYVRSNGDLRLACRWSTRIGWFYASWTALAETIAAGHETPEEVVRGWMESPGHRAKILSRSHWETGVGYWAGGSERHYWVEDFGRRGGSFPLVIDGEARSTPTREVRLYVYGSWSEMRLRNDDGPFGPWRTFASDLDWRLAEGGGLRTVMVEMRDGRT
jgi:uncharacterized protein YkwD